MKSILKSFEFDGFVDLIQSLYPTIKYGFVLASISLSLIITAVDTVFGLDALAVFALLIIMFFELASGTYASYINKIPFSSQRLSRFTFKVACYFILIALPHLFAKSYGVRGNALASTFFEWLHVFLVVQIVIENIFSILENMAVIQGKEKTFWINKIQSKMQMLFA